MAGRVVLMHYYSTETLDTQLFQLGTVTPFHYPLLTALEHLITHTAMRNYCISHSVCFFFFFTLLQTQVSSHKNCSISLFNPKLGTSTSLALFTRIHIYIEN